MKTFLYFCLGAIDVLFRSFLMAVLCVFGFFPLFILAIMIMIVGVLPERIVDWLDAVCRGIRRITMVQITLIFTKTKKF